MQKDASYLVPNMYCSVVDVVVIDKQLKDFWEIVCFRLISRVRVG